MTTLFLPVGQLSRQTILHTARCIADTQLPSGAIPWFDGHLLDPWDHVEAAMGLSIAGFQVQAAKAYRYLARIQEADGGFWPAYADTVPLDRTRKETHHSAYLATGVWHHYLITADRMFLEEMWPHAGAGLDFACERQTPHGEIAWTVNDRGHAYPDALVTGCSSIYKSLECGCQISQELGDERADWIPVRRNLGRAIRNSPHRFDRTWASKARYSMDWFYPVLCGVITGPRASRRLLERWEEFVLPGLGCRCVSDEPWFTVAETCELIMALTAAGHRGKAASLFADLHRARHRDGSFWTGYQSELDIFWPRERPTWTAGAVLLAADALAGLTPAAHLFTSAAPCRALIPEAREVFAADSPG
ncbi:prenyltransferase [Desulfovermiculus halophilus]|uniref:prenyltransferase n=1 Tax=Desulfovermiculus halophilus TaxID=339722 RepID=UPI0006859E70|nr:prenyltransferase [Desulfovermiculus halophilus]